ncbi:MAG TPA: hypothetical protein VJ583_06375 [Nitrososphaeraceae archaeon]|nr:hypothetical protein [Nitrososphaeraceae archaeon]
MTQKVNDNKDSNNNNKSVLFQKAYANAVNQAMEILGERVSQIVQDYIEDKYFIKLENTYDNPAALTEALNFAIDGGKRIIERRIIKILSKTFKLNYHGTILIDFEKQINDMRKSIENM